MADLVEPLDRALRSTRVLVRQTAVATYRHHPVPASYSRLVLDLADATDQVADELDADRLAGGGPAGAAAGRRGERAWSSAPRS